MQFKGSSDFEEFWEYLEGESPRGAAIVVAAYFDEKLADLLARTHQTFSARIHDAFAAGLLTQNERDDLHVLREIRNSFAHDLRARDFDSPKAQQVDSMKTWQIAVRWLPQYTELFPTPKDRMLYVTERNFFPGYALLTTCLLPRAAGDESPAEAPAATSSPRDVPTPVLAVEPAASNN